MSVGLRSQRARIYTYSDTGTNGEPNSTYTFVAERWCRKGKLKASEGTVGAQAQHDATAVLIFADEVTVTRDGVVKHNGRFFKVESIEELTETRELEVVGSWVDGETLNVVGDS